MIVKPFLNANASVIAVTGTAAALFDLINTAGSTAKANAGFPAHLDAIDIFLEDGDIRVLFDGNTPTASKGILLKQGGYYTIRGAMLSSMKLIRTGGSNVSCSLQVGLSQVGEVTGVGATGATSISITELPDAAALNGTWPKTTASTVLGAAMMVNDGTNLVLAPGDVTNGVKTQPAIGGAGAVTSMSPRVTMGSTSMLAQGTDATGQDGYATILTPASACTHLYISLEGSNAAIISLDNGVTDHFTVQAGSILLFDGLTISASVNIQAKNRTGGSNYTNLNMSAW